MNPTGRSSVSKKTSAWCGRKQFVNSLKGVASADDLQRLSGLRSGQGDAGSHYRLTQLTIGTNRVWTARPAPRVVKINGEEADGRDLGARKQVVAARGWGLCCW